MKFSFLLNFFCLIISLLLQVLLFRELVLFNTAYCFIYVIYILLQPASIRTGILMILAFILGIAVDTFYDSVGLHAMSLVCMAFLRKSWFNLIVPTGGHEKGFDLLVGIKDIFWFIAFAFPLVFIHHFILFFTEVGGFGLFWFTLLKVVTSAVFTISTILFVNIFITSRKR